MAQITDEYMREMLTRTRPYTIVILKNGPNRDLPNREEMVWEHGRRNFSLRAQGILPIVCPVTDDSEVCGLGIFDLDVEETKRVMDDDPGVLAGMFVYEVHPCRSFPGAALPG